MIGRIPASNKRNFLYLENLMRAIPSLTPLRALLVSVFALAVLPGPMAAENALLLENVRIFNGVDATLAAGHVLVEGKTIAKISDKPIDASPGATVIAGKNRILSPGFIDLHAHLTIQMPRDEIATAHPWIVGALANDAAESYLMSGFTTVRDAGGTHPDLARAVERGWIVGPRIFPSGALVSQTSGHGDFRSRHDPHPTLHGCGGAHLGGGLSVLADGVPQTLTAVRENLKNGATQIKIMGGGGVASDYDPIHTLQPSPEEIRAAVQAASDWGTYVMAHSYTSAAIQRLVENGVKVIEHGLLIDEETARLCAEKDVVISTQVAIFRKAAEIPGMAEENRRKMLEVLAGQDNLMQLIKKYDLKTGFGTDLVFGTYPLVGEEFTARTDYFTPAEILRQATSESAEIIRLAGKLNRYGNFGEIREGWVADLLLIEGDPFRDISILERPDESLAVIIKGGEVVKNRTQ
jgi:imidazolonepropionase-like amidohydrolase